MTQPFEKFSQNAQNSLLFLCDHASNRVPDCTNGGSLGLPDEDMARHIAFDVGARGVTLELAKRMQGSAVLSTFSRLVIDPNRAEDDPTLIMQLYDGTVIPGNHRIDAKERTRRLDAFHRPYHRAIKATIDEMKTPPTLISIHSFTPKLRGKPDRPWHIGVLSADDRRLADPLLRHLEQEDDICVGDNEPYIGKLEGDCMAQHALSRGLPHVLIEIRNDLIENSAGQILWSKKLDPILRDALEDLEKENPHYG